MTLFERLRVRLALAIGQRPLEGPCPEPEDIVAWHERALPGAEARRIRAHVAHCETCYALWTGLLSLDAKPQVVPEPSPHRWRRGGWLALPVLALGVIGVALLPFLLPSTGSSLPDYTLSVQGGLTVRGGASEAISLADGSALEIVLAPDTAWSAPVQIAVFAETDVLTPLDVPSVTTDKGVVIVDAIVGEDIKPPVDTRAIWVVLAREGQLPDFGALRLSEIDAATTTGRGWRAWRVEVDSPTPLPR